MFCEKCGTENPSGALCCSRCGEKMPKASSCGGFADILSFEAKPASPSSSAAGAPSPSLQKFEETAKGLKAQNAQLEKKINALTTRVFIALGLSVLSLVLAIVIFFVFPSTETKTDPKKETEVTLSDKDAADDKKKETPLTAFTDILSSADK